MIFRNLHEVSDKTTFTNYRTVEFSLNNQIPGGYYINDRGKKDNFLVKSYESRIGTSYFLLLSSYFLLLSSYFLVFTSYLLVLTSYFLVLTSYFRVVTL